MLDFAKQEVKQGYPKSAGSHICLRRTLRLLWRSTRNSFCEIWLKKSSSKLLNSTNSWRVLGWGAVLGTIRWFWATFQWWSEVDPLWMGNFSNQFYQLQNRLQRIPPSYRVSNAGDIIPVFLLVHLCRSSDNLRFPFLLFVPVQLQKKDGPHAVNSGLEIGGEIQSHLSSRDNAWVKSSRSFATAREV